MHKFLAPNSDYSGLSLEARLHLGGLDFTPYRVEGTVKHPERDEQIKMGKWSILHPTDKDNPIIGTVGADYTLTDYHTLFEKFDAPLLEAGFTPSGVQSFKHKGGARLFYTNGGDNFGKRTGPGHTRQENPLRATVFFVTTGINGLWSTGFGGYIWEQWCSNGACRKVWQDKVSGIRHTKTHDARLEDALDRFNWIAADMAGFSERMDEWAKKQANAATILEFTKFLIPDTESESKARENQRADLTGWIISEATDRNRAVTYQDLLQGVTAYNTHDKVKTPEDAFTRILRGESVELVDRAETWITAHV